MPNTSRTQLLVIFLLAGFSGCSDSDRDDRPTRVPAALQADLQAIVDDSVASGTAPGIVLQVSADGQEAWSTAAGLGDIEQNTPIAPNDRFRAGSILKPFVATAVLQAVETGTLGLDDRLTERLPAAVTDRIPNADAIQLRMLLGHRSGIADWVTPAVHQAVVTDPEHVWSLDEILAQVAPQPPMFAPGEGYAYSNTNYILLGEMLSGAAGHSWREVLRTQVIARAGLQDTSLPDTGDLTCPAPCAHGYATVDDELRDFTRVDPSMAGASGGHALITTPADLARFLKVLRSGALFEQPSTLQSMFAFQPALDPQNHQIGYGFGLMQLESDGNTLIGHLGTTAGYQSFMLYVPATDRYVSGFMNVMGNLGAVLEPIVARAAKP